MTSRYWTRVKREKTISFCMSVAIFICGIFTLSSCGLFDDEKTNSDAAKDNLEKLIDCLDTNDGSGVKALFAPNKTADIQNFDDDVSELLDIYKGSFVSHNFEMPATIDDIHYNAAKKWFIIGAVITTTQEKYRATMYWCDMDTSNKGNVGIWSLYMFNVKDNPLDDYSFYGDSSWDDDSIKGIHVVRPYKYIEMTTNILQSGNVELVKTLFAPNAINKNSAFDKSVENFFANYSAEYTACTEIASDTDTQIDTDGHITRRFRLFSYSIETTDGKYSVALKYCDWDTENSDNIGLHSVYIQQDENSADTPFWGDGLWLEGLNCSQTLA